MRILRSACFVTHTQQQGTTAWAAVDVTLTAAAFAKATASQGEAVTP
jgi:hypothetical protein